MVKGLAQRMKESTDFREFGSSEDFLIDFSTEVIRLYKKEKGIEKKSDLYNLFGAFQEYQLRKSGLVKPDAEFVARVHRNIDYACRLGDLVVDKNMKFFGAFYDKTKGHLWEKGSVRKEFHEYIGNPFYTRAVSLPGLSPLFENQVYVTHRPLHNGFMGPSNPNQRFFLLAQRYELPKEDEVFDHLREKIASLHRIRPALQTKFEKRLTFLQGDLCTKIDQKDPQTMQQLLSNISSPLSQNQQRDNEWNVELIYAVIPSDDINSRRTRGEDIDASWYFRAWDDPQFAQRGLETPALWRVFMPYKDGDFITPKKDALKSTQVLKPVGSVNLRETANRIISRLYDDPSVLVHFKDSSKDYLNRVSEEMLPSMN